MDRVRVLPADVSQLIAAGEVVERPASVIKELVENAIDAGASVIRVDIEGGGVRLMRVTDNGCGMTPADAKTCFLRHATSKIQTAHDISGVVTLGFRGEALASIAAVSRVRLITRTEGALEGTCVRIEGGTLMSSESIGAPIGTSITIEDLFYNTPARKKFLKSERSETGAIGALMDRLALSHPEISFRYHNNSKEELYTPGDGQVASVVSAVLGTQTARAMVEVNRKDTIGVSGLICRPLAARGNRNQQYFFINGRCITSGLLSKAMESAYSGSIMVGKFPSCVLFLSLDAASVDVNVHPSKNIVKFSDDKVVFNAVYAAVSQALDNMDQRHVASTPALSMKEQSRIVSGFYEIPTQQPVMKIETEKEIPAVTAPLVMPKPDIAVSTTNPEPDVIVRPAEDEEKPAPVTRKEFTYAEPAVRNTILTFYDRTAEPTYSAPVYASPAPVVPQFQVRETEPLVTEVEPEIVCIGEIFNTYIIAQCGDEVYFIDKHAAHERLIFEKLKGQIQTGSQPLLVECVVSLNRQDKVAILEDTDHFAACGFELEDYGGNAIMVRAIPSELASDDISDVLEQSVAALNDRRSSKDKKIKILEVMACKAAVKGGQFSGRAEQQKLLDRLFAIPDVKYCPHGRPIICTMTKKDFEKMFKRIV